MKTELDGLAPVPRSGRHLHISRKAAVIASGIALFAGLLAWIAASNKGGWASVGQGTGGLALWAGIVAAYWAPTLVGWRRHVRNLGSIAVINFFAVLFVPWVIALAMACSSNVQEPPTTTTP